MRIPSGSSCFDMDPYRDAAPLEARAGLHRRFSTNPYGWFPWVFDRLLALPGEARLLELGCGHGLLWKENAARIPPGWDITLSDLSPGMLDAAWRNLVVTGRAFRFREIDARSIPFEEATFDAVIANHMLYHLPERRSALAEIRRVLRPGGRLLAATVGEDHMREMAGWLTRLRPPGEDSPNPFTLENGREQLEPYFAQVGLSRYADSLAVTELEPIAAYIRSVVQPGERLEAELAKLELDLARELREKGKIVIKKDTGLFEAIR